MSLLIPKGQKRKRIVKADAVLRDRDYLDWLRTQPCVITGRRGNDSETVDPMHVGTLGKGLKSPDNEALPVIHGMHQYGHDHGEVSLLREQAPDWLLREAFRAYARQLYSTYKKGTGNV